jgi:hypothetical protein
MKKELPFPNRKLERSAIKYINDEYYLVLKNKINIFNSYKNIKVLYEARYEALCMYNGCEGTKAGEKFWSLVEKAEKAILRLM